MQPISVWALITHNHDDSIIKPYKIERGLKTFDAITQSLPGGAYTTFRTYDGNKVIHLDQHFDRLEETASLNTSPVILARAVLREALRQVVTKSHYAESRLRIVLDLEKTPGETFILVEPLRTPSPESYENGVSVITQSQKRSNPKAKLTGFIKTASQIRQHISKDIEDVLMVDECGSILEGLSSNFFAFSQGELWTAENEVLSGITRSVVLEEAKNEGVFIHLCPVKYDELSGISEAFITSSSRAVLPVIKIDSIPIGNGKPGPYTRLLLEKFLLRIKNDARVI